MEQKITLYSNNGNVMFSGDTVTLVAEKHSSDTRFSLSVDFPEWENDAYVFLPACVYNGNRFKRRKTTYPPEYTVEECGVNPEPIITDVPALNHDGSGRIEVTSGDLSVPCFGVFFRQKQLAFFVFTEQACKGKKHRFLCGKWQNYCTIPCNSLKMLSDLQNRRAVKRQRIFCSGRRNNIVKGFDKGICLPGCDSFF